MSTEHPERPPLHLPHRPSKGRRDLRNRLVHADERAHAPARPERGAHEYATVDGRRRRLSFRGIARFLVLSCWTEPMSIAAWWQLHHHHAGVWKPGVVAPPTQPAPGGLQLAWDGESWMPAPAVPAVRQTGVPWLYGLRLAWGLIHIGVFVVPLDIASWIIRAPGRALLTTALIWVVFV